MSIWGAHKPGTNIGHQRNRDAVLEEELLKAARAGENIDLRSVREAAVKRADARLRGNT